MSMRLRRVLVILVFILTVAAVLSNTMRARFSFEVPILNPAEILEEDSRESLYAQERVLIRFHASGLANPDYIINEDDQSISPGILLTEHGASAIKTLFNPLDIGESVNYLSRVYILHLEAETDIWQFIDRYKNDPNVEWIEPDYLAHSTEVIPNDPYFASQWALDKIGATSAWDESTGSVSVSIAIVDSGVSFSHSDLASKLWVNPGEIPGNALDDDNNGYVDDVNGWDFVNNDNDPSDDHGHGTQVAGIAAAATDNDEGISGVCWECRIMPVKVMQTEVANYSDIALGILYAAQKGARIINVSLGGYSDSATLHSAIRTAVDEYDAVVVAGVGNDNISTAFYPAAYDEVLSVAGTNQDDIKTGISNFGSWVDITSPGETITTTFLGGDYGPVSGTSYAAPFASGTAALLISVNGGWSESLARAHIIQTADDIEHLNPGLEGLIGSGRLNAASAMTTTAEPLLSLEGYSVNGVWNGRPVPGESFSLEVTLFNEWGTATNVQAQLTSGEPFVTVINGTSTFDDILTYVFGSTVAPFRVEVDSSTPFGHGIDFNLNLTADGGYSVDLAFQVMTESEIENVSGLIISDTTWSSDKTYLVGGNILVQDSITLTVEPGTTVLFHNYQLVVDGTLKAVGTEEYPIVFTSAQLNPISEDWQGIATQNGGKVELSHCEISYAFRGATVYGNTADWTIDNCSIHHNHIGIMGDFNALLRLENSRISLNSGNGVQLGGPDNRIHHNVISYNGFHGIDASPNSLGIVSENLIHHNNGYGFVGAATAVISNTIIYNRVGTMIEEPATTTFTQNNILANSEYDVKATSATNLNLDARMNWWGTTDTAAIDQHIFDWLDNSSLGFINYSPVLTMPNPTAPAYLMDLTILPDVILGIQTATFETEFSQPMDDNYPPKISFQTTAGNSETFNSSNSPLPDYDSCSSNIAVDDDNVKWVGTNEHGVYGYDDQQWISYDANNSPVSRYGPHPIAFDRSGIKWIGNRDGLLRFDNSIWTLFDSQSTGIPYFQSIENVAVGEDGMVWASFSGPDQQQNDIARFNGVNWTYFDPDQTGLPNDSTVADIEVEANGSVWFGLEHDGVVLYDGTGWTIFDEHNSGLPSSQVTDVAIDYEGAKWFATDAGVVRYDGLTWSNFTIDSMGLGSNGTPKSIAIDESNTKWVGLQGSHPYRLVAFTTDGESSVFDFPKQNPFPYTLISDLAIDSLGNKWMIRSCDGVTALYGGVNYGVVDNPQWLNDRAWSVTYDISSLIPRGVFKVIVGEAVGSDGLAIVPDSFYTFTVDYAGSIGDTSPPSIPLVDFCAGNTPDTLSATWTATDPESSITLFRYGIGTTPGSSDVINWTYTSETTVEHGTLDLFPEEMYYIAVRARNEGGLWSEAGIPPGVEAGSGVCSTNEVFVFLPALRN